MHVGGAWDRGYKHGTFEMLMKCVHTQYQQSKCMHMCTVLSYMYSMHVPYVLRTVSHKDNIILINTHIHTSFNSVVFMLGVDTPNLQKAMLILKVHSVHSYMARYM